MCSHIKRIPCFPCLCKRKNTDSNSHKKQQILEKRWWFIFLSHEILGKFRAFLFQEKGNRIRQIDQMLRTTAFLLRKIFKIFRNLFPKPNKRIRRVNINRKIRRLGKHLNHLQLLYIRIPLYRYTSLYIGRGQVLFQNLFLTYPTPILGRIEGEFCERTKHRCCVEPPPSVARSKIDLLVNFWTRVFAIQKHRCYVEPPPSVAVLMCLFSFRTKF